MTHTLTEVREIAARLIEQFGDDYTYEPVATEEGDRFCRYYTDDGQPSCFVGHVLDIWHEGREAARASDCGPGVDAAWELIPKAGIECERDAITYLNVIQEHQDNGVPWGRAVLMAEHRVGLHPGEEYVENCAYCEASR